MAIEPISSLNLTPNTTFEKLGYRKLAKTKARLSGKMKSKTKYLTTLSFHNDYANKTDIYEFHLILRVRAYSMWFSVAFIFWVSDHVMVSNHQYKYKNAKKIGKKPQVLIINHLLLRSDATRQRRSRSTTISTSFFVAALLKFLGDRGLWAF